MGFSYLVSEPPQRQNGQVTEVLKNLNWPTVALIVFSGGANWLSTNNNSQTNRYEIERARDQINQMFGKIDDFEARQKAALENEQKILEKLAQLRPSPTPSAN
jgi:TolA-binding protein